MPRTWMKCTGWSSSVTRKFGKAFISASALITAVITVSSSQARITSTAITQNARPGEWSSRSLNTGRKMNATKATASSRADMPVMPAGRPAAMCGSAPSVMPSAATATTWVGVIGSTWP